MSTIVGTPTDKPRDPATGQFVPETPAPTPIPPSGESPESIDVVTQDKAPLQFEGDDFANSVVEAFEHPGQQTRPYERLADITPDADAEPEGGDQSGTEPAEPDAPVTPSVPPPDPGAPGSPDAPVQPESVQIGDWDLPAEHIPAVRELYDWATNLPAEQHQAINDLLSGNYYLVPRDPSQVPPGYVPVQGSGGGSPVHEPPVTQPPAPAPAPAPTSTPIDPGAFLDPAAAAHMQALQDRLDQMAASQQQQQQQQAQVEFNRQQSILQAGLIAAKDEFKAKHGLSDDDLNRVIDRTTQMQVIPGLIQRHVGDPKSAFVNGFEAAFYSDPVLRHAAIQREAAIEAERAAELTRKKGRASSVGASSGPVPRTAPARKPLTSDQTVDAMAAEIEAAMNGAAN